MQFKNITMFRFPESFDFADIEQAAGECALKPCPPLAISSVGFVPPLGEHDPAMIRNQDGNIWITVATENKLLPGAVVKEHLAKKLAEIEKKDGKKPGGRTRKRLKDEIISDLLPKAFVKTTRTDAIIIPARGLIAINSASRKASESVVAEIRRALGSFPALPLYPKELPRHILTEWVFEGNHSEGISIDNECVLDDGLHNGESVKIKNMDLSSDEVEKHITAGKKCSKLAITVQDRISFTIDSDLVMRKVSLLDLALNSIEQSSDNDLVVEMDASFLLMASEINSAFGYLESSFSIQSAGEQP